jgi:dihydroorotase-like cyclic amidohydrolase
VRTGVELREKIDYVGSRALVDFAQAAHAWPGDLASISDVWRAGPALAFTCTTHGVPAHNAAQLRQLFMRAAELQAVCLVHCEDESLTADTERILRLAGRSDAAEGLSDGSVAR